MMLRTPPMLNELINRITDVGRSIGHSMDKTDIDIIQLCEKLVSNKGEATGLALAREILDRYLQLADIEKLQFFHTLSTDFSVDEHKLQTAIKRWQESGAEKVREIHFASEPKSQTLIRRLNRAPGATRDLVAMRRDLMQFIHTANENNESLRQLDNDFKHLLSSWFNRGFLELRRIEWSTSAEVLERIIQYEAVHEIKDWDDLRRRVAKPDRRLYAFFHPSMMDDPLIFVEVALLEAIPGAVAPILAESDTSIDPHTANTAAFYSISNCQPGLRGIAFGNFLIKQAVMDIRREFPNIRNFATLSPIPGFRRWATSQLQSDHALASADQRFLQELAEYEHKELQDESLHPIDSDTLKELVAYYIVSARKTGGQVIDPVARFHLGNGARLDNIHTTADLSPQGIQNSWGAMVNYVYELEDIERNHEAFASDNVVTHSKSISDLLNHIQSRR